MVKNKNMPISKKILKNFICPKCKSKIHADNSIYSCENLECSIKYPVIDGIPILINEDNSIFNINDFNIHNKTTITSKKINRLSSLKSKLLPKIGINLKAKQNYYNFLNTLVKNSSNRNVLVIGGEATGNGMECLMNSTEIELTETDVSFGSRTMVVCDGHDIPFQNNTFDGVIVQAVLEHVVDPYRCVEEIHRVLKDDGIVYSETPFMQQVHMGRHDFTRFTHLGHRRLFRKFEEIESGPVCGPGMALAWSIQYFFLAFTKSKIIRKLIIYFTIFTSFFWKYFDYYLINKEGSYDSASGYYFFGKKSKTTLSDRDLIESYRGSQQ